MLSHRALTATLVGLAALASLAVAPIGDPPVPLTINHEGLLLDDDGLPMEGDVILTFAIYDGAEGGLARWTEQAQLSLVDGYYSLRLGLQSSLGDVFDGTPRYLGVTVGEPPELSPRHPLSSVPYAVVAGDVVGPIHPESVWIGDVQVIDEAGNWRGPEIQGGGGGGDGYSTPAEVLAALLQVDGPGSGLQADLLDGVEGAAFVQRGADLLAAVTAVDGAGTGIDADRLDGFDSSEFLRPGDATAPATVLGLLLGVDGSLSTLDADRLDGLDSGAFMRRDGDTNTTGSLDVGGDLQASGDGDVGGTLVAGNVEVPVGGSVGVGTDNPEAELDVVGEVATDELRLRVTNGDCTAADAGTLRWTGEVFEGCDGEQWTALTGGDAGGGDPGEPTSFAWGCDPGSWSYSAPRIICSVQVDLPEEMAVIAHVNGHWNTTSGACFGEILFDNETTYPDGNSVYQRKEGIHAYSAGSWMPVGFMRSRILPAGPHTFSYAISTTGACSLNGSSLHGIAVPTGGQGREIVCDPAAWSYSDNADICSVDIDLPVRSAVVAHFNGHWNVPAGGNWCMAEILFEAEAPHPDGSSAYVNRDGLHGYETSSWQAVSSSRVAILEPGSRRFKYAMRTHRGCSMNGTSLHGVTFPAPEGTQIASCIPPAWDSHADSAPCSHNIIINKESLVLSHVQGHWLVNNGSWGMLEILYDGAEPRPAASSAYVNRDGIHGYWTRSWLPVHTARSSLFAAGAHLLRYYVLESGTTQINGSSMRTLIIPR